MKRSTLKRILLVCALVATLESPIGHSTQGFVMRYTVSWCEGFYMPIQIERQMLLGENGPAVGGAQTDYYAVPKPKTEEIPAPTLPMRAP